MGIFSGSGAKFCGKKHPQMSLGLVWPENHRMSKVNYRFMWRPKGHASSLLFRYVLKPPLEFISVYKDNITLLLIRYFF